MFRYPVFKVKAELDQALEDTSSVEQCMLNLEGFRSPGVINRLVSLHLDEVNTDAPRLLSSVVSEYAATAMASRCGPLFVKKLVNVFKRKNNGSLDGHYLEMFFFAQLDVERHVKLRCPSVDGAPPQEVTWRRTSRILQYCLQPSFLGRTEDYFLKPQSVVQGAYDAIMVLPSRKIVRFIQVTRGTTHSVKLRFIFTAMHTTNFGFDATAGLEYVFVVTESTLDKFNFTVENRGMLS